MSKEYTDLSMEEFALEIEQLSSEGLKFDVESQGGNISLSLSKCDISVYHANDFCGEVIITRSDADLKFVIDYNALDSVERKGDDIDMKYLLEMDDVGMSDVHITIAE